MAELNACFDRPGALFTYLERGQKFPPATGKNWPDKPMSFGIVAKIAEAGYNVAAIAGNGHIGLDEDDPSAFEGLDLPATTTWETRPGRCAMRFICDDRTPELLAKYGKKADLAQFKLHKNGEPVGELKLERTYQVIPPSWKYLEDGTKADYVLLSDAPPAQISLKKLLSDLVAIGITFEKTPKEALHSVLAGGAQKNLSQVQQLPTLPTVEDLPEAFRSMATEVYALDRKYVLDAIDQELSILQHTTQNRNIQLNQTSFKTGSLVATGLLSKQEVRDLAQRLLEVALCIGLERNEAIATIESGSAAGLKAPRDLSTRDKFVATSHEVTCGAGAVDAGAAKVWHKPTIKVANRDANDVTNDVLNAMVAYNNPPNIFKRNGSLVRLQFSDRPILAPIGLAHVRQHIGEVASYVMTKGENRLLVFPPKHIAENITVLPDWPGIPEIKGLIETPVIRSDGTVLSAPGYDLQSRLYLSPIRDFSNLNVPENPTQEDAKTAAQYLAEQIFSDFPFEDNASRANAIGLLISIVARPLINGNVPIFLFDKPQPGTGASLALDATAQITTGRPAHMGGAPQEEAEWRKMITSSLLTGQALIGVDNVAGALRSPALARVATAQTWSDRLLGGNTLAVLPANAIWVLNGNSVEVAGDLARRIIYIRMISQWARPWERTEFLHPDLLGWIGENHCAVMACILVMIRAWYVAGHLPGSRTLGSFANWAKTVSGIMEFSGLTDFMGNMEKFYDEAQDGTSDWDAFLRVWSTLYPLPISSGDLYKHLVKDIDTVSSTLQAAMPSELADLLQSKKGGGAQGLGKLLRKYKDKTFPSNLKLVRTENTDKKVALWGVDTSKVSTPDKSVYITGNQSVDPNSPDTDVRGVRGVTDTDLHLPIAGGAHWDSFPVFPVNHDAVQHGENLFPVNGKIAKSEQAGLAARAVDGSEPPHADAKPAPVTPAQNHDAPEETLTLLDRVRICAKLEHRQTKNIVRVGNILRVVQQYPECSRTAAVHIQGCLKALGYVQNTSDAFMPGSDLLAEWAAEAAT